MGLKYQPVHVFSSLRKTALFAYCGSERQSAHTAILLEKLDGPSSQDFPRLLE